MTFALLRDVTVNSSFVLLQPFNAFDVNVFALFFSEDDGCQ
jgi:hypothetical protein